MPGAIALGNAEMYAARDRLVFDRAALLEATGEVAATVERSRADAAQVKRLELQQLVDRGIAALGANDRAGIIGAAKAMQVTYNELAQTNEALRKSMTDAARKAYEDAQARFVWFRTLSLTAISRWAWQRRCSRGARCAAQSPGRWKTRSAISMRSPRAICAVTSS